MVAKVLQSDIELKPCPFCGGADLHIETDSEPKSSVNVFCDNPACEAAGPNQAFTAEHAALAWNNRAMVSVPVELLRKVLDEFELETFGDDYASEQMQVQAERMRGDIAELRRIAGIQTP